MDRVSAPSDLTVRAWWHALRDATRAFRDRDLTDAAAALTYYAVLSVFPGLIVLASLLGVLGSEDTIDSLLRIIDDLGPSSAVDTFRDPVESLVDNPGAAGVALVVGSAAALWSASGYVGAFMRTSNTIYQVDEDRPFWKLRPFQLLLTLVAVVLLAIVALALVMTGPLAESIGDEVGIGDTALTVWSIAKWPLLFAIVVGVVTTLYRLAPNARHAGVRWILPGSVLATVLALAASVGFAAYVANFGSYANTYGSLAGVVVFLIWIWLANCAVLFGAQFAAELERTGAAAEHATPPGGFAPFVSRERGGEDEPEAASASRGPASPRQA